MPYHLLRYEGYLILPKVFTTGHWIGIGLVLNGKRSRKSSGVLVPFVGGVQPGVR